MSSHEVIDQLQQAFEVWLSEVRQASAIDIKISSIVNELRGWRYAERALRHSLANRILSWNGLMTDAELPADAMMPEYAVAVLQHDAIAVYHRPAGGSGGTLSLARELPLPPGGAEQHRLLRRLARTAVRAVYALGLDLGLVRIAVAPRGRLAVRGVDPFPASPAGLAGKYAAALAAHSAAAQAAQRVSTSEADIEPGAGAGAGAEADAEAGADAGAGAEQDEATASAVLLGLDVEFVLTTSRGELVPADRFLPRSGAAGHDAAVLRGRVVHALAELRPAPSGEPRQLFANLRRAMRLASQRIADPALEWRAGGSPVAGLYTGGHIHISGVPLTFELLRTLDNYLALPLSLLEDAGSILRRPVFGWLGHARRKPHGGFEYRTPPSWIASPAIALGVIALAKLIAVHHDELKRRPLHRLQVQRAYYEGDHTLLRRWLPQWREDLMKTASYGLLERQLRPFFRLLDNGWRWDEQTDIRDAWRLKSVPVTLNSSDIDVKSGPV